MAQSLTWSFKAGLTDVDATAQEQIGTIRADVNAEYKYVRFTGTNVVAVGDLVGYVASAGATDTMTNVDGSVGTGPAGVAMAAVPSGAVAFGWIQISGLAKSSAAIAGGATAGQTLKQGTYPAFTLQTAVTIPNAGTVFDATNQLVALTCPH